MTKAIDKTVDAEMAQFQRDLLLSVRQMKAGKAARTSVVVLNEPPNRDRKQNLKITNGRRIHQIA